MHDLSVADVQLAEVLPSQALQTLTGQLCQVEPLRTLSAQVGCKIEQGESEHFTEGTFCEYILH